jgi:alpha-D-ribose 1-methylphosphonate 5-triphosphate diphosphatase
MHSRANHGVLANARVVLADRVIDQGWVEFAEGLIVGFGEGEPRTTGVNLGGDLLIPGLVELHTDHLEAHYMPRPKVFWDPVAAVLSYDASLATCGITTVLDSLRLWRDDGADQIGRESGLLADAIATARERGMLRADHFLHLRCEVPMPDVVAEASDMIRRPDVKLLSLMDHTPGQRQFRDEEKPPC